MNPQTPVIVGVAQILHRMQDLTDVVEPLTMMLQAARQAETDSGARVLPQVQSVRVINGLWQYDNPAKYLAEKIGASGAQTVGTLFGGNYNQVMVNDTAETILRGELDLVLITGAEAGYAGAKLRKAGRQLEYTGTPGAYDVLFGGDQKPEHHEYEQAKGIRQAIQAYPMYDNAIRYHRGETIPGHLKRVSELWARFNRVAQGNPNAWIREPMTAEVIRTPSPTNRAVSFPYTKLMNSNNNVDMGAALIMCSVAKARSLGIPEAQWVYPWAGVEGFDHFSMSVRHNFYTSPGIRLIGQRLFELAGVSADELDYVDLYSCFPAAVQVAAKELGLSEERDLTVTGGLTFGGGPLNNYVMHSIARTVELLRASPGKTGLVTANGGNLYKHAHGIYGGEPPAADFVRDNVQERISALPSRVCLPKFTGEITVESYTVMYGANGPAIAHVACQNADGERVWMNTDDPEVMLAMTQEEFCGRRGRISGEQVLMID
ncbi:MAG: acetyl-CoA acetyltransferase [Proteobacteria bacterium]|jgi:acetyl-CoA C-acetyltransferase|nr:acetyl-CoA acetyltransferase [Pseudomonadota bacterium]